MKRHSNKTISTILSKILIFIFVVLFVSAFKTVFGAENSLVGVTTIVLALVLLEGDLTGEPLKNLVHLIIFNLILGLGAFIAWQNVWIGIVINFAIMASIGYIFSYELRKSINMMFGLHYILLMTSHIIIEQLPMRLLALVFGACIIMGIQLIANKNKLEKSSKKILNIIYDKILEKISLLKQDQDVTELDIDSFINKLKIIIFDSGKKFSITNDGRCILNVLSCFEKINILLDTTKVIDKDLLEDIHALLVIIKDGRFNKGELEAIACRYKRDHEKLMAVYEFITAVENLNTQIYKLNNLPEDEKNNIGSELYIPEDFKDINIHKRNINLKSNRVAYGIRLGIVVALTTFITNYFNLQFGNWMVYTVFALTQPHAEFTRLKSKKRIVGTVIGSLIIFTLFNIVKDPTMRTVILLTTGYLMGYVSDYRNIVMFVTITSIASAALNVINPNYIIMNRLMYVIIGIIISLIANKFILHRKYRDEEINVHNIQKQVTERILKEILENECYNENIVEGLYLIQVLIENRVQNLNLSIEKEVLFKNKILLNDIYQIHLAGNDIYEGIINEARKIISNNKNIELYKLKEFVEDTEDMREKILLNTILTAVNDVHYIYDVLDEAHIMKYV